MKSQNSKCIKMGWIIEQIK